MSLAIACAIACGGGKSGQGSATKDDAVAAPVLPAVAPIAMPPLGVDRVTRFNFIYDAGAPAYEKAVLARKAKNWAQVKSECETALAKDPQHLDAHWLLGIALAHAGEHAAAVDHLAAAIAGDYYRYGAALGSDADLVDFLATPHGKAVAALSNAIRGEYGKRIASGVWVVARRSTFKWPKDYGVQYSTSRGELYAYDRELKRYLRLTHTDHAVDAFVRAPAGDVVALVGYDKIDRPKDGEASLARPWVQPIDAKQWTALGPRALPAATRALVVGYGAGDELVVAANGQSASLDRTTGKLAPIEAGALDPRVEVTLDDGRAHRQPGVTLVRAPDGNIAGIKTPSGVAIQIPESGLAAESTIIAAPDGAHVAFATVVDPCAKDTAPSLYIADGKSGALRHVLSAKSRFATRWIDATTLAYEDGDDAIRLWDTSIMREVGKLEDKAGLALDVLAIQSAPVCKQQAPAADTGSAAGSDEMPHEEPPP